MGLALMRLLTSMWLLTVAAALPGLAQQEQPGASLRGVALVIGQSDYRHLPKLANPAQDARQMEEVLRSLGFEPTMAIDLDVRRLKRAIDRFAEDAEGADVAVVYYAGHGIEAAGENWLLPVDASVTSLEAASRDLAGLSSLIATLQERVPLVIVFLDACRSNPFPPGSLLVTADGETVPVSASGLQVTRGASASGDATEGIGTLIGFAAEPGRAALDGPPEGNSPYATALVRHLSAMGGLEFGTVMRMVAEEVYLRTRGQQRPWVNETLTRLIYLGVNPSVPETAEGVILAERRQLLLTIASLPEPARQQVETAALTAGVPMDALYGLLRALDRDVPPDAAALERLLAAEAERVKALLAQQQALDAQDPEIVRLSDLAAQALADGALDAYLAFWQQAKSRYLEVSGKIDAAEAQVRARRLEGGQVLAGTASAFALRADYPAAAGNYALAFAEVSRWDEEKAWGYRQKEAGAWLSQGEELGDAAALETALATYRDSLSMAPRETQPLRWAEVQNNIGNTFLVKSRFEAGTAMIENAVAAFRQALEVRTREDAPRAWARTQNNLAIAYTDLAERTGGQSYVASAVEAYRAALAETPRAEEPLVWATLMNNLGDALSRLGSDHLAEAVAVHRAALEERPRERVPLLWAASQENLGSALVNLGKHEANPQAIREAIAAYNAALEVGTRERVPLHWAGLHYNLGNAHGDLAGLENAGSNLEQAVFHYEEALKEQSFARTPEQWGKTQYMLGERLWALGEARSDTALRLQGIAAQRQSLQLYTRERNAADWAVTLFILGTKLQRVGVLEQDAAHLEEAVDLLNQSLDFYTRERDATDWADTMVTYADALANLGSVTGEQNRIADAIDAFDGALDIQTRDAAPLSWAMTMLMRANALMSLAILRNDDGPVRQGRDDVVAAAGVFAGQGREDLAATARRLLPGFDEMIASLPP